MRLTTLAPAKVNLVLRVGPLRADGYHELLTLMAPLDLGDRVDVRVSTRPGGVTCQVPGRPELCGPANLAARAAAAFRDRFGVRNGVSIRIDKRTPVLAPQATKRLIKRLGFADVTEMEAGESREIGRVRLTATPAVHGITRHPMAA